MPPAEPEPPWLDDHQQQVWRRFVALVQLLPAALETPLQRDTGLTMYSYLVLAMLSEAPDRTLRMSELAALSNASLSRLSHAARRLELGGLVIRRQASDDARATIATLTDAGWDTIEAAAPAHVATVRELIIDRLTDEQLEQLDAICCAILDGLPNDGRRSVMRPTS